MKNSALTTSLICVLSLLSACTTFQMASVATMAFTGKGFGDHALSSVTGQDCAFFNIVQGQRVCSYDNSVEMVLLTNNQIIDDSLKVEQPEIVDPDSYLVIGSFSKRNNADSYQSDFKHWDSSVLKDQASHSKYLVVVGPLKQQDTDHMKKVLEKEGIQSPWLITL